MRLNVPKGCICAQNGRSLVLCTFIWKEKIYLKAGSTWMCQIDLQLIQFNQNATDDIQNNNSFLVPTAFKTKSYVDIKLEPWFEFLSGLITETAAFFDIVSNIIW